jgi:hypothetical protein
MTARMKTWARRLFANVLCWFINLILEEIAIVGDPADKTCIRQNW